MDIDIDFKTKFTPTEVFDQAITASRVVNNELVKHPCGHYFQHIPVDPITGLSAIPYEDAEELGFFKIDFLHLSTLDIFTSKDQIRELIKIEPDWSLLEREDVVVKLFQISKQFELVNQLRPKSVVELADCIALIRPGKKYLIPAYLQDKDAVRPELYKRVNDGYYFKKSHAISYALTIVLQLHLIEFGKL